MFRLIFTGCTVRSNIYYVIFISGTEPLSYYLINGFLNFNVVFFMAILSLPFLVSVNIAYYLYLSRTVDKHKMY